MIKKIERDDIIFSSTDFMKDALVFNIAISILQDKEKYKSPKCFSDGANCVIVCSDDRHPVIVWTKDSFSDFAGLFDFVRQEFRANNPFNILSKLPFYEFLKNRGYADEAQVLGVYQYDKSKYREIEYLGHPDNIQEKEVGEVAEMLSGFDHETGENTYSTSADRVPDANFYKTSPLAQVWRNAAGKIVATTLIKEIEQYGRIEQVFTKPDERGKQYAKMLVHFMTKRIFDMGKKPMLFTDFNYAPSNKCYTGIGYDLVGTIVSYNVRNIRE
ncbi:MAG: GNAT family N-acetyltransferase [Rickettsiales bacterium]|jgi:GNAT superfamily N-acetyltransferase|nr:GNAT family N-acetyltransferase [Rickettsiales bacterium]